jgi:hypothetical protein
MQEGRKIQRPFPEILPAFLPSLAVYFFFLPRTAAALAIAVFARRVSAARFAGAVG